MIWIQLGCVAAFIAVMAALKFGFQAVFDQAGLGVGLAVVGAFTLICLLIAWRIDCRGKPEEE